MPNPGRRRSSTRLPWLRALLATVCAVPLLVLPAQAARAAEEPAVLVLEKSTEEVQVTPGQVFAYELDYSCTTFGDGCTNATIVDTLPAGLQFVENDPLVLTTNVSATLTVDGQTATITFTEPIAPGTTGLPSAESGTVVVSVRVDPDLPYSANGVPLVNSATLSATNPSTASSTSTASVTPQVPLNLSATATKRYAPNQGLAAAGTATTLELTGTSTSSAPVSTLTIVDPIDPAATPNPFEYLALSGTVSAAMPTGADRVQIEAYVNGAWVPGPVAPTATLPAGDPAAIRGLRATFSSTSGATIEAGSAAGLDIGLVQRANVSTLGGDHTVNNTAGVTVARDGAISTVAQSNGTYQIRSSDLDADARKTFSPTNIPAGSTSVVTLSGTNASPRAVDTLTITEPASGSGLPFGPDDLTVEGMGTNGSGAGIVWPQGATSASVTYRYASGAPSVATSTTAGTLPAPEAGRVVTGFTVTYSGTITSRATATLPFVVRASADQADDQVTRTNVVDVSVAAADGATSSTTASASLTSVAQRMGVSVRKQISPSAMPSRPGEFVVVQLPFQLLPFPATTARATTIVIQDPETTSASPPVGSWWDTFDARSITQTGIPSGATLTINYWNGTAWVPLPGAVDLAGPQLVNETIDPALRDQIQGLQFVYTSAQGFEPGSRLAPNFTAELRTASRVNSTPQLDRVASVENCASATASNGAGLSGSATVEDPCPTVQLSTTIDSSVLVNKRFIEPAPGSGATVNARSLNQITSELSWSALRTGIDEVVITDTANPETTPLSASMFNAFDLVAIRPIAPRPAGAPAGATIDPLIEYDRIARVELWNGTAWVATATDPCATAANCIGRFGGYTLTAAERASTSGVRLVVAESPNRAAVSSGNPTAPQPGDGVARSTNANRPVRLTFEIRDFVRAPEQTPDPALGRRLYNLPGRGDVQNTTRVSGFVDGVQVDTASNDAMVTIIDQPLNVIADKTWTGGPLGQPPAGSPAESFPSGRVTVRGTNRTPARVDELKLTDPAPGTADNPFDAFDLKDIVSITAPPGATGTEVILTDASGTTESFTLAAAQALTEAQLADVVGIEVRFTGRIQAGSTGTLVMDLRLRDALRGTTTHTPAVTYSNRAGAEVADLGGNDLDTPTSSAAASITVDGADISVLTTKTINPATVVEPGTGPITVTVTGRPGGSTRPNRLVLTDAEPRFWNQYDFVGFGASAIVAPADRVQVDALTGATFTLVGGELVATGGTWTTGTPGTTHALPAGVQAAEVQGLRFTYTRADGAIWENPANPTQRAVFTTERRGALRTGGPVPHDLDAAAPGETVPGRATNVVRGDVFGSVLVNGQPITNTHSSTAGVTYVHASNEVTVAKRASFSQRPDVPFEYTLEVTNPGSRPIVDPVVTDRFPMVNGQPQIVFDDANPGGQGAYSYTLTGPAPATPNGPAMPEEPSEVTATVTGDVEQIRWTFPAGTVLEAGQTYTIRVRVEVRPGVASATVLTNQVGVTSSRPWDVCNGTLDPDSGECRATADIRVEKSGSVRSQKLVRAVDTELGVTSTVAGAECVPTDAGFYRGHCLPRTKPGSDEVWRINMSNSGNLPVDQLVVMDLLPRPGDTGVENTQPRNSAWDPILRGDIALIGAPADATLSVFYTTGTPCRGDLQVLAPTCAPGEWLPLPADADAALLDSVNALKLVVDLPTPLAPLASVAIDVTTTTPAVSPTEGPDPVAWNSIAFAARTLDGGVRGRTLPVEGAKTGAIFATGDLEVQKLVTGDAASFAPETFDLSLVCSSAPGTPEEQELDPVALTVAAGEVTGVDDLPWGASCTVTEDGGGATTFAATTVTVGSADAPRVVATNTYDLAELVVTKTLSSAAVDQDGVPVAYGPFAFSVECSFLGQSVIPEGFTEVPATFDLTSGAARTLTGLPAGANCTVTETDDQGAAATTAAVTAGEPADPVEGTSATLDLEPLDATNEVAFTNTFEAGSLLLTKVVDGDGAEAWATGSYRLAVSCLLDDPSGERTVFEDEVVLGGDRPLATTLTNLAAGATCTVTELDAGGATTQAVSPGDITVVGGQTAEVTVTNTFELGAISVTKELTGPGAERYGTGPFEVTLVCTREVNGEVIPLEVPGGAARDLAADGSEVRYEGLPAGAACELSETLTGGAMSSLVEEPEVTVVAGETVARTVVNDFQVGEVRLLKTLSGTGAALHTADVFTFDIACTREVNGEPVDVDIPGGSSRSVSGETTMVAVWEDLPLGASCVLTEAEHGSATDAAFVVAGDEVVGGTEPFVSGAFVLPETDPCLAVEAVNHWGTEGAPEVTPEAAVRDEVDCSKPEPKPEPTRPRVEPTPSRGGSNLARTGSELLGVAAFGLALLAVGAVVLGSTRWGRRRLGMRRA